MPILGGSTWHSSSQGAATHVGDPSRAVAYCLVLGQATDFLGCVPTFASPFNVGLCLPLCFFTKQKTSRLCATHNWPYQKRTGLLMPHVKEKKNKQQTRTSNIIDGKKNNERKKNNKGVSCAGTTWCPSHYNHEVKSSNAPLCICSLLLEVTQSWFHCSQADPWVVLGTSGCSCHLTAKHETPSFTP